MYKRQLLCIGVLFYGIAMLILRLSGSATMAVLALLLYEPVSYTHLDVYKRQHLFCALLRKACNAGLLG